jgi:hypothetical protein
MASRNKRRLRAKVKRTARHTDNGNDRREQPS